MITKAEFDQVFTTDKRITSKAMRVVRTMHPNIGAAYSDAREEGRRYKFQRAGACLNAKQVKAINEAFRATGIKAVAYLHVMDGRGNPYGRGWNWNGYLCVRTYNETNTNNTNTTTTMSKSKNTTANPSQDIANIIASALEKHFAGKPAKQSSEGKEYQFTEEELKVFVTGILQKGADAILDDVRTMVLDQDSDYVKLDLDDNRITVTIDTDSIADEIEEMQSDWDDTINHCMERWYEEATC